MPYTIERNGYTYKVWTDADGKVTHAACRYTWDKMSIDFLDEPLITFLQVRVNELRG